MKAVNLVKNSIALVSFSFLALSCATGYQKKSLLGFGYSEMDAGDDKKRISFNGSFSTDLKKTKEFTYQRAETYCKEQSSDGFEVLDEIIIGKERTQKDRDFVKKHNLSTPSVSIVIRCLGEDEEDEG